MPELPEVETIRRQLNEVLSGRKIVSVEILRAKSFEGEKDELEGWSIEKVERKAKVLEFYFKSQTKIMIVHLKMTGQLVFVDGAKRIVGGHPTADWIRELPSKHTRVIISFQDGSRLFFNDMRVFGWMKLMEKGKYEKEVRKTAPDVTEKEFSIDYLTGLLSRAGRPVKLVLTDQEKIGGVGNIYANDALYLAGIRPDRKANSLNRTEIESLYKAVREVINKGIRYGGASAANYVDTRGLGGTYQEHFLVYKQDGKTCDRCGGKIKKMKMGGRGTFYCLGCQK